MSHANPEQALRGRQSECQLLRQALTDAREGKSQVLVLRGEPGSGKSALLGYLSSLLVGWRRLAAVGVESEMELAYSGLHQLCCRCWTASIGFPSRFVTPSLSCSV